MMLRLWRSRLNIPRRTFWYIFRQLVERTKLFQVPVQVQESKMSALGLTRKDGLKRLDSVLKELMGKSYDESDGMFSEHLILLASISVNGISVNKILEIGTFDGRTALILSRLFPSANIVTIDLPSNEEEFENSYNRYNSLDTFLTKRKGYLSEAVNVEFREVNSLELSKWEERFDLIWIDGAHGYPVVAMDVINSFRLASENGYVLIDDIRITGSDSHRMYKSVGGFESLQALVEAKLIPSFYLFYKRLSGVFNTPGEKKYVGLFVKK